MNRRILYISTVLSVVLLLSACTAAGSIKTFGVDEMKETRWAATRCEIYPGEVPHQEDYVIQWEDEGMEAHIRFLLDKPQGDIYHSDVWDIRILKIKPGNGEPHDVALKTPQDDDEVFDLQAITSAENADKFWHVYEGKQFPPVESFADLRHFDNLQLLTCDFPGSGYALASLRGIEKCTNLQSLSLTSAKLGSMKELSELKNLTHLTLLRCGSLDLEPLANHPSLKVVQLDLSKVKSLEPLASILGLDYLSMWGDCGYPELEPLSRSTIRYLNIGHSTADKSEYEEMDYLAIGKIPNLVYLDTTGHDEVDVALCNTILEESATLQYLILDYTTAAKELVKGKAVLETEGLKGLRFAP